MAINVGTLISSAIRPNDSLDPIASAWASEIKGGFHTVQDATGRNSIIFERREWGMMCYVVSDNQTYQLVYGLQDTNIMNNNNWAIFSGSGGGGGSAEWIDSVLSVLYTQPLSPSNGDRYLVGKGITDATAITGINWSSYQSGLVVEWNSTLTQWTQTQPTDGMSVRVDNEDNSIYRYEGVFPSGAWQKEKTSQVRNINATTIDGISYIATTDTMLESYQRDLIFLVNFSQENITTTASININSMGDVQIKRPSQSGLIDLNPFDITSGLVYSIVYDGTYFQLYRPFSTNDDVYNIKYNIESTDYIVVPPYHQYWIYNDLQISGILVNYGKVIVANGSITLTGGTFSNYGEVLLVDLDANTVYNNSSTIQFTQSNTTYGLSMSAEVINGSLTASKLDTDINGGATAGYILSVDDNGYFKWVDRKYTEYALSLTASLVETITHNLGTQSIICQAWDSSTGEVVNVTFKNRLLNSVDILSTANVVVDVIIQG